MSKPRLLTIIPEQAFRKFVDENLVTAGCDGLLRGCKHCLKLLYEKRNAYLASWFGIYFRFYNRIVAGQDIIPALYWYHAPTAVGLSLQDAHAKRCTGQTKYEECTCGIAIVLRYMYPGRVGTTIVYSLDVILDWFVGMLKKRDAPGPGS